MDSLFTIATPCPKTWNELQGEGRQRYCNVCNKSVHALEQYSGGELDRLRSESEGHLCGMIAGESVAEPRSRRAVLVAAFLTTISPLMAQSGRVKIQVTDVTGASIANAEVILLGSMPVRALKTNPVGEVVCTELAMGDSKFEIRSPGFRMRTLVITLRNDDEVIIQSTLEVANLNMGVMVEVEKPKKLFRKWKTRPA